MPPRRRVNISFDQATSHSSDRSSLTDEEDSSGVQVSPPSFTGSHDYHDSFEVDGSWDHLTYPDELKPSDSASRARPSHYPRGPVDPHTRSRPSRHQSTRRRSTHEREPVTHHRRRHRDPPPPPPPAESPESVDSGEEYDYAPGPPDRLFWPPAAPAPPPGYAHSASSGPSYSPYQHQNLPPGAPPHGQHGMPSNQLVQLGPMGHPLHGQRGQMHHPQMHGQMGGPGHMPPYPGAPYPYDPRFHPGAGHPSQGYFNHPERHHPHHHPSPPQLHRYHHPRSPPEEEEDDDEDEDEAPPHPALAHAMPPRGGHPFPGSPFGSPEMVPYSPHGGPHPGYFQYPHHYPPIPPGMFPPQFFHALQQRPPSPEKPAEKPKSPEPAEPPAPPPPPQPDAKDEAIARLEKLILDERMEREARDQAREAAILKAAQDKAAAEERAAADKKIAADAAAAATAAARAEAEAEAEKLRAEAKAEAERLATEEAAKAKEAAEAAAAEEAAKAKAAAEEATAAAVAEAAAAATSAAEAKAAEELAAATKKPAEKKKPVKFKDAVGRKFSFPFHLCSTWQGMEELIRQAFLHVDVIGQHVAEGHYDLVGPNGDIILPQVWDTVVEPDWTVTMHMWPIPEKPKEPDPPPGPHGPPPVGGEPGVIAVVDANPEAAASDEVVVVSPPPPPGPKKPKPPPPPPGAFAKWVTGNRGRPARALKAEKKPEVVQQQDEACCVM